MQQKVAATEEEEGHDGNSKKCCGVTALNTRARELFLETTFFWEESLFKESRVCQPAKALVVLEASFCSGHPSPPPLLPFPKADYHPERRLLISPDTYSTLYS